MCSGAVAQGEQIYRLSIASQSLSKALQAFGTATGLQIARFAAADDAEIVSGAVTGSYTAGQALNLLLAGSGFDYRFINDRTVAIVRSAPLSDDPAKTSTVIPDRTERGADHTDTARANSRRRTMQPACQAAAATRNYCAQPGDEIVDSLEAVIVTAQRRQENLQKTPLAVTVVTAATFQKLGGGSVAALQLVAPNVQISTNGSGGGQIGMRGITTANTTDVGDPAVAFELDGVYQARAQTQGSALFDVDRIEVLRGPQGTLYGRNATTGVINVISRKPTQELSAEGYVETGNYRALTGFAALNVPLSDAVAMRGAFISINHAPIYDNGLPRSQNYGDQEENAGRVHLAIRPMDDLSILLSGNYSQLTGNGGPFAMLFPTLPLDSTPYKFRASVPGHLSLDQRTAAAALEWHTPLATLSYDGAVHQSSVYTLIGANVPGPAVTVVANPLESATQQHELRLSDAIDAVNYVGGIYYFRERQVWNIYVPPIAAFLMPDEQQDSRAAFGQATWSINSSLRLTAGLRHTRDRKHRAGGNYTFGNDGALDLKLANLADVSSSRTNYRVGLDYDLASAAMMYASFATGYKAGGFFDGMPPANTFAPENVASAEIGLKSRFFSDRLQLNLAAFNYDYTDFQVSYQNRATLITTTYNAQRATNRGVELEIEAVLSDSDRLALSLGWLHARYAKFDLIDGAVDSYGYSSYTGKRLPFAPDWGINLNAEHVWSLVRGQRISLSVLSHWQSASDLEFHGFANTRQQAYSKTDVNLSWTDSRDRYSVTAFVRNAENAAVATAATLQSTSDPMAPAAGILAMPRTYGLRVNFALQPAAR